MTPPPGERLQRFIGDTVRFTIRISGQERLPKGWRAFLRTNLGRGDLLHREILDAHFQKVPLAGAAWRDIPMREEENHFALEITLAETGFFKAKAYLVDAEGRQHWPEGPNFGLSIHPDACRTANIFYCAFPRLFGQSRFRSETTNPAEEQLFLSYDKQGYSNIPASGKLRDLTAQIPHIVDQLGCTIVHLLPVNPTPTVYARFGRFGSPYAVQDLAGIDPALVEFDKKTTALDQFRELVQAIHWRGAKLFLDIVINHTGWGSTLMENHPEWFLKDESTGEFVSPGAWGTTWEDLVELDHRHPQLWDHLADVFLTWCRRGVDGFRCDAGYKVPTPAWQYIIAKVHQDFPETIFFLEGLGGAWEATESLLTDGGMQWAYSELFQNYSPAHISGYLDHAWKQGDRVGALVHYSETHDNDRLAKLGKTWSLLRNQLCALASQSGAFGFTCGVEWLAQEKIRVHGCTGLNWEASENIVPELSRLNRLLQDHPCFFDHAQWTRLSAAESPVLAVQRTSAEGVDQVLILINTDVKKEQEFALSALAPSMGELPKYDLLTGEVHSIQITGDKKSIRLAPGQSLCLSEDRTPRGLNGNSYRRARSQAAFGIRACHQLKKGDLHHLDWKHVAGLVDANPVAFLAAISRLEWETWPTDFSLALSDEFGKQKYAPVSRWKVNDATRAFLIPSRHWLLLEGEHPFRAELAMEGETGTTTVLSIPCQSGHIAAFPPRTEGARGQLHVEMYGESVHCHQGMLRFLPPEPLLAFPEFSPVVTESLVRHREKAAAAFRKSKDLENRKCEALALFTNGLGGMARVRVDLGSIQSKYDCLLAANLHPHLPVDRHVFIKRLRAWINADGFITPLNWDNLVGFEVGPPGFWRFLANAGDGRSVELHLQMDMLEGYNALGIIFSRPFHAPFSGKDLPDQRQVKLVVRFDIEDRNFHSETKHNGGAEHHFRSHCHPLSEAVGFAFTPAADRQLKVTCPTGVFHPEPEWCHQIPHPVELSRGQEAWGDAYSPGWFEIPLAKGSKASFLASADLHGVPPDLIAELGPRRENHKRSLLECADVEDRFGQRLALASAAFVVRRGEGKTVIAGYPWFLDWGRDTFICARGLLAAGRIEEVRALIHLFGRFEKQGTLPNTIHGEDASNRDTSDAPLWYGVVCHELSLAEKSDRIFQETVDGRRTVGEVLQSIADHYWNGTPNGIRADQESALIWSPSHFTWMDTNYPAGTPREGYPIEIQVLWIQLLQLLDRLGLQHNGENYGSLARRAEQELIGRFWLEEKGYLSDCLLAAAHTPASQATVDESLRSNYLFAISFRLLTGERAQRAVQAALDWLVVPGALRSLAPLPVRPPLPIRSATGRLLNNPDLPYQGRYQGDEDTSRKPAYHNGTAWTWTFPVFCEALAAAWSDEPAAIESARGYLGSAEQLILDHCIGHIAEIFDGDYPHHQRGCDAQAWGATEALRVWKLLEKKRQS